jgi:hypothetical protein
MNAEAAFASINGVPVIGTCFLDREQALSEVQYLTEQVARYNEKGSPMVRVSFRPQSDGRFSLEVGGSERAITVIPGVDELMLRRFYKAYNAKKMFILTSFVGREAGSPVSLVVSDGLGVVIYKPHATILF